LGLDQALPMIAQHETLDEAAAAAGGVVTTADPEVQKMAADLIARAETPELKDRIRSMLARAGQAGEPRMPEVVSVDRQVDDAAQQLPPGSQLITPESAPLPQQPAPQMVNQAPMPPPMPKVPVPDDAQAVSPAGEPQARASEPPPPPPTPEPGVVRVKATDNSRFAIQLGSYPQMGEATRAVERLKAKGYSAFVAIADLPDRGRWYRVRIGGFDTKDDASRYVRDLSSKENVEALVVLNDQ
jgi:cell division septation protein DedD